MGVRCTDWLGPGSDVQPVELRVGSVHSQVEEGFGTHNFPGLVHQG